MEDERRKKKIHLKWNQPRNIISIFRFSVIEKIFVHFFASFLPAPSCPSHLRCHPLTICFSYIFHSFPSLKSSSSWATKNGSERENKEKKETKKKVCRVDGLEIGAAAVGVKWRALIWAAPWKKIKEKKLFAPLYSYLSARQDDLGKKKRKRRRRENGKSKYLSRSIGRKTTFMSCQRRWGCLLLYSLLLLLLPPSYTRDTPESETKNYLRESVGKHQ